MHISIHKYHIYFSYEISLLTSLGKTSVDDILRYFSYQQLEWKANFIKIQMKICNKSYFLGNIRKNINLSSVKLSLKVCVWLKHQHWFKDFKWAKNNVLNNWAQKNRQHLQQLDNPWTHHNHPYPLLYILLYTICISENGQKEIKLSNIVLKEAGKTS